MDSEILTQDILQLEALITLLNEGNPYQGMYTSQAFKRIVRKEVSK